MYYNCYTHEVSFASSLKKKESDPLLPWGMSNPEKQQSIHGDERGAINKKNLNFKEYWKTWHLSKVNIQLSPSNIFRSSLKHHSGFQLISKWFLISIVFHGRTATRVAVMAPYTLGIPRVPTIVSKASFLQQYNALPHDPHPRGLRWYMRPYPRCHVTGW